MKDKLKVENGKLKVINTLNSQLSTLNSEGGQALLIVVLVMVVVLTVGLSVASRSIVNLRITSEEQQSQRAFSAAEAGIELALKNNQSITQAVDLENNSEIREVVFTNPSGNSFLLNGGNNVIKDEGIDVWLVDHNDNGTINYSSGWQQLSGDAKLTLYWGSSSDACSDAAIEMVVISGTQSDPKSKRYAFDPCSTRRSSNNFDNPDSGTYTSSGKNFFFRETIDVRNSSKGIIARIIPLYSNTSIAVKGCNKNIDPTNESCTPFPSQGEQIESTGVSGETTRKVTLFQGYPSLPGEFFGNVLFCAKGSGGEGSCIMQ